MARLRYNCLLEVEFDLGLTYKMFLMNQVTLYITFLIFIQIMVELGFPLTDGPLIGRQNLRSADKKGEQIENGLNAKQIEVMTK